MYSNVYLVNNMSFCDSIYVFLNQARTWFTEIVLQKVCVSIYLPIYLCTYVCLSIRTHVSETLKW